MHNPELIRDHGDYLERHYSEQILNRLGGYALFWARYIGNDNHANYLPMPGVDQAVVDARVRIWEHLYTLFESFALCWRLEERFRQLHPVTSPEAYADNLNDWIAFYAHLGRIHDMAEKVAQEFNGQNLFAPFDTFYEQRHMVLHYPKVPMCRVENVLAAPEVLGQRQGWSPGKPWSELDEGDLNFLGDIVASALRDLENVTSAFLYQLIDLAAAQKGFVLVQWPCATSHAPVSELAAPAAYNLKDNTSGLSIRPSGIS